MDTTLPINVLYDRCTGTTLQIANQKSGHKIQRVSHSAIPAHTKAALSCPIRALIRRLKHIQRYTQDTSLQSGTYFDTRRQARTIRPWTITNVLQLAGKALNLHLLNILPHLVSSHSLRAGGATAMHINSIPDSTIQKICQWSSDTFLIYIRDQLFQFSNNITSLKIGRAHV